MEKSSFNHETSLESRHSNSNFDNQAQYKPFHIREYYSPSSKLNGIEGKYQKVFHRVPTQASEVLITLNGIQEDNLGNSIDFRNLKENSATKNELEAVPERSNEHSEMTNKTNQIDSDLYRVQSDYDLDDTRFTRPLHTLLYEQQYRSSSKVASENLNTRSDESGQEELRGKKYLSLKQRSTNGETSGGKSSGIHEKESLDKETFPSLEKYSYHSVLKNELTSPAQKSQERVSGNDKNNQARESSRSDSNSSFRKYEYDTKLSRSNLLSHSYREDTLPRTHEHMEVMDLLEQNEKLEERIKKKEQLVQTLKTSYDELYKNYREVQEKAQKEKELYSAQKLILSQFEEREAALKRENDEIRQTESRLSKMITELEAQVGSLKAEIAFLNSKHDVKVDSLKSQIKRLEEENLYLLREKKKRESKRPNLHELEVSNEDDKHFLRKTLEESRMQMHMLSSRNEDLVHKIETLKKFNQDREKVYREKIDESAFENKRTLEEYINQVKDEFQAKIHHYKTKIDKLTSENENLKYELDSKPSLRKFKENESRIHALEDELEELKRDTHGHKRKQSEAAVPAKILKEIAAELEVEGVGEILPKLKEIHHEHKTDSKFVNSLLDLVHKCSPKGYFEGRPTYKQAWSWIKRLMAEYMTIKKHEGGTDGGPEKEILKVVMELLRSKDKNEVPNKLSHVLGENSTLNDIVFKVKILHKLEWVNSLNELDQRLRLEINTKFGDPYLKSIYYKRSNV